jgi:hypothetical protein
VVVRLEETPEWLAQTLFLVLTRQHRGVVLVELGTRLLVMVVQVAA